MIERPILFSGPMVRAILEGRKTQTRRVVALPKGAQPCNEDNDFELDGTPEWPHAISRRSGCLAPLECPYGVPGDRLWVRETWRSIALRGRGGDIEQFMYRASIPFDVDVWKWKPGIHMPRHACRLVLEMTTVRVERLQEIGQQDVFAEGLHNAQQNEYEKKMGHRLSSQDCYRHLWNSLNAKRGYGWDKNPYVWVIEFKRVDR